MEDVNKRRRIYLSLFKLGYGPQRNRLWGNSPSFGILRIGIDATKFEKTRIHFTTDVFAAVAVVDAKAPYLDSRKRTTTITSFFAYSQNRQSGKPQCTFDSPENLALLPL